MALIRIFNLYLREICELYVYIGVIISWNYDKYKANKIVRR